MRPTLCRMVLYTESDGVESPAVVTRVISDTKVGLTVFPFGRTPLVHVVAEMAKDNGNSRQTWRWPPRDEALTKSLSIEDVMPDAEKERIGDDKE